VGDGEDTKTRAHGAPSAAAPASSSTKHTFWVQLKGDAGLAPLTARGDMLVGFLVEEVASKLKLTQRTSSLILQLASEDGTLFTAKGADGNEQPVTLNSMVTIDKVLKQAAEEAGRTIKPEDKLRLIVDVAAPAATTAAAAAPSE
jgi:hypothetical protein